MNLCTICETDLETGHLCHGCHQRIRQHLTDIVRLCTEAAAQIEPTPQPGSGHSNTFGSRPPINLDAIDPELTLIPLNLGDPTSAVPILEMLEMWERVIREERNLTPYGLATAARCAITHTPYADTQGTLTGCVRFLHTNLDWIAETPDFPVDEFADHVRRAANLLRRWEPNRPQSGTRVPCPTVTEDGDCGYPLMVRGTHDVDCRRCGRSWQVDRLLLVAGREADVWVDAEALAHIAGVHERTIRKWHAAGKVAKKGQQYRLQDVRAHAESLGA